MLDGSLKNAKVLEIAPDSITIVPLSESGAPFLNSNETVPKALVLLIEYKNGTIEIYNVPKKNATYNSEGVATIHSKSDAENINLYNFVSINTLALCYSDISGFFEHLHKNKFIGFGAMAAFNFNTYVTFPDSRVTVLNNAKKNYDIGLFANFYPTRFKRRSNFYVGILVKYTSFNFSRVVEDNTGGSVSIRYFPSEGSQLATLATIGNHRILSKRFYLKTFAGLGAFKLKGDYKQQYNYIINKDNKPGESVVNYNYLLKIYLGVNLGFEF